MARVRLADVAARVGVSSKTVSNVVNGTGWVGDAVRQQVLEAIEELGYRPNLAARQLRGGSSGLLGLCVPSLREPYFAEFASEFVDAASARGLTVLVTQSKGRIAVERSILENENLPAIDGLVFSPLRITADDLAARRSTVPLILIGEHGEQLAGPGVAHFGPDNVAAAETATQHLIAQGRRRIAVIGAQEPERDTARLRLAGYRRALEAAGIPFDPELVIEVEHFHRDEGSRSVEALLDRGVAFDGVFCFNDTLAFGALYTLGARGVAVPEQVAVIGYDNIEEGRFLASPLSTIDPGVAGAAGAMLDLLAGPREAVAERVVVPFALVER